MRGMSGRSASAPGKAVLCGEYAVLRGGTAIAMAIDRRAHVHFRASDGKHHVVSTPGYADGRWRFRLDGDGKAEWLDAAGRPDLRLLEAALATVHERLPAAMDLTIDTREFFDATSHRKLGFGSSAAAAVALLAALQRAPASNGCRAAMQVHRSLQDGRGSGVDVATSCRGGVIRYRKDDRGEPERLAWPDGVLFRFLWSGRTADTGASIRRLEHSPQDERSWRQLHEAAEAAAEAFSAGKADPLIASLGTYTQALSRFSVDHDLGIFEAGHDAMVSAAAECGVVYKPCGAGGGDIGIVVATSAERITRFCNDAIKRGFMPLDVTLDERGVETKAINGGT